MDGWWPNNSTALSILTTVRAAAFGSSSAIYAAISSRFLSAPRSHLTRTARPLAYRLSDFAVAGEIACIRLGNRLLDLPNLPFVDLDVVSQRFGGKKGTAPLRSFGELVQLLAKLVVNAQGQHRIGHFEYLIIS